MHNELVECVCGCGQRLLKYPEETRKKLSESHKGKISWNKGKKCPQISKGLLGNTASEATRRKMSESHKEEKCNFWRGGITPEIRKIRNSLELK